MDSKGSATPARVYQEFEPSIEWANEDECDVLLIYLPGFAKEQLRVQLRSRSLIVTGERRLHENTWTRFRKEFLVSETCDIKKISAKFEDSILFVRQPKSITPVAKQEETPAIDTPSPMPENAVDEPKLDPKASKVEPDSKPASTTNRNGKNGFGEDAIDGCGNKVEEKDEGKVSALKETEGVCENASEKKGSDLGDEGKRAIGGFVTKVKASRNAATMVLVLVVGVVLGVYCSYSIKSWMA